jgi:DNA replication protein DnaC
VPARFAGVTLETVRPRPSQRTYLEEMRRVPTANYALTGPPATGKSHLMWALYATVAQDVGRRVVACSLLSLVDQYRSAYGARTEGEVVTAAVHPSDLEQNAQPYSLFLDDVDKPRMTDYVIERVHALFDAAYNYGHQVVVTSNLHPAALTDLYTRHHGHYGAATMRRVLHEGCTVFKFE